MRIMKTKRNAVIGLALVVAVGLGLAIFPAGAAQVRTSVASRPTASPAPKCRSQTVSTWQVIPLAAVQGFAELLPVSSSAHVIVTEKVLGISDPTTPEMVLLLLILHTGTMLAVIVYFWKGWKKTYFASGQSMRRYGLLLALATVLTGVVGLILKKVIERMAFPPNEPKAEIERLFANLPLMAVSLACVGVFIIIVGLRQRRYSLTPRDVVGTRESIWMGFFQGLCLPFRGFSRSGATISAGMALGVSKRPVEEFSFALGVILTPIVIVYELHRLAESLKPAGGGMGEAIRHFLPGGGFFLPGLVGLVCSFIAGMLALRWLSSWLERGRWHFFGFYCLAASAVVLILHFVSGY